MNMYEWKSGKTLRWEIDNKASKALEARHSPLYIELELYFSCLIRKRTLISDVKDEAKTYHRLSDRLFVTFSPVMTRACAMHEDEAPELVAFPIKKPDAYLPKWLKVTYKNNSFVGEFGY